MSALQASGLTLRLGGRTVLEDIDFTLARGELVGLLGPNGAGKSTLLKALARLLKPARGRLAILGRPAQAIAARELARQLAYLPQGAECHWDLAVEQVVALGRLPHRGWLARSADDYEPIRRAMVYSDVAHLSARAINALSGGEQMRVLLARALAGEPSILLADEPISGLDPAHRLDVMALLQGLARAGAAVLVVLHDLTLAARFCDRLVLLHAGRVAASGAVDEVLTPAQLARCFEVRAFHSDEARVIVPVERILGS